MRCQKVVWVSEIKTSILEFCGKTMWGNYGKRAKSKRERKVSNRWNHARKREFTLNAYICVQGEAGLKNRSKDRYALNIWPQTNVVEYFLWISPVEYTRASPSARKMSFFSSIIITIILSYAIIRVYTILHIFLQVSKTEGLAELHWVIGLSVLEKINSIYF